MSRSILIIAFIYTCSLLQAQLSGSYTIGGIEPDYSTFNEAIAELEAQGVSSSVDFLVRPGTYEEPFAIGEIPGNGGDNWVIFRAENGEANSVTLQADIESIQYYLWQVDNAGNIRFQDLSFFMSNTNTNDYQAALGSSNGPDALEIIDCEFNTALPDESLYVDFWGGAGDVLLEGNTFLESESGIYVIGSGELIVRENFIDAQDELLDIGGFENVVIENNEFDSPGYGEALLQSEPIGSAVIQNNEFVGGFSDLMYLSDGGDYLAFLDNTISGFDQQFIDISLFDEVLVERTRVEEDSYYFLGIEDSGDVTVSDNDLIGIEIGYCEGGLVIQDNVIRPNSQYNEGMYINDWVIEEGKQCSITNNLLLGNGENEGFYFSDIDLPEGQRLEVVNNTITKSDQVLEFNQVDAVLVAHNSMTTGYEFSGAIIDVTSLTDGIEFVNNVVYNSYDSTSEVWQVDSLELVDSHHNVYFWTPDLTDITMYDDNQGNLETLDDAQAYGLEVGSVFMDPLFYDDSLDLRICNGGLESAGVLIDDFDTDYFGVQRDILPTPGIYEFRELSALFSYVQDQSELEFELDDPSAVVGVMWDFGDGGSSTELSPTHFYSGTGEFTVSVTVENPCGPDLENEVIVMIGSVGLLEVEDMLFRCYPNPVLDELTIESLGGAGLDYVELIDITGRTVMRADWPDNGLERHSMNINDLHSGLYLLRAISEGEEHVIRIKKI